MSELIDRIIQLYQRTLSPDHGVFSARFPYGFCRFTPSCSQYARDAVRRYGIVHGIGRAALRILRCNPFTQSRHDPVH